jgi:hypothetical protein
MKTFIPRFQGKSILPYCRLWMHFFWNKDSLRRPNGHTTSKKANLHATKQKSKPQDG